jgi:hypothetical protein
MDLRRPGASLASPQDELQGLLYLSIVLGTLSAASFLLLADEVTAAI